MQSRDFHYCTLSDRSHNCFSLMVIAFFWKECFDILLHGSCKVRNLHGIEKIVPLARTKCMSRRLWKIRCSTQVVLLFLVTVSKLTLCNFQTKHIFLKFSVVCTTSLLWAVVVSQAMFLMRALISSMQRNVS